MVVKTLNPKLTAISNLFQMPAPRHVLVERLELISLTSEPFEAHGQSRLQLVDAFE